MFDFLTPTTAGLLMLVGAIPPLGIVYWLRNDRHKPAVGWFQLAMVSGMAWSVLFGLIALVDVPQLRFVFTNFLLIVIPSSAICYFLFCYEFTFKKTPPKAAFLLFVPILVMFIASWFNPSNLIYTISDPHLADEILIPANSGSVRPILNVGVSYLLVIMSAGMVLGELMSTSQQGRKIQSFVILLTIVTIAVLAAVKILDILPAYFDPTPIGWTISGLLFAVSIKRYRFLQESPAPWDQITNQSEDLLILLDSENVIAEINTTARELLDIHLGMTNTELQGQLPELTAVLDGQASETGTMTIELEIDGEPRFFDTQSSTLTYGHGAEGQFVFLRDITERKAAQNAVEETKERYHRIFQQSSDYVIIVDSSGQITHVTAGVTRVLGYEPDEVLGRDVFGIVHPDDKDEIIEGFEEILRNPELQVTFEHRARTVDGDYRWIEARSSNQFDDPLLEGAVANVRDISQRKQREQELDELTTRHQLALEGTDTGVWERDLTTDEVMCDQASEQLFGYEPGTHPGTWEGFSRRVPDDDLEAVEQAVAEAIETGQQYQADYRIELPDGEQRWILDRGIVEYDAAGQPNRIVGINTDITDRKTAEQALEETKAYYQRILEQSLDYAIVVDESDTITDITPGVEDMSTFSPQEVIGNNAFEAVHPDDVDRVRDSFAFAVENPESILNTEYRVQLRDGSYRWVEARGRSHLDDPLLEGIVISVRDISERKQQEQQLAETAARLTQKNEQLERLAQIVSHDLQTPLSTAERLTELLRMDLKEPKPAVEQSLADLEATHRRLRGFADHLPRLARESTDIEESTACDLQTVAEAAWKVVETGSLELAVESTCTLSADPERLQRAFENLFQNTVAHGVVDTASSTAKTGDPENAAKNSDAENKQHSTATTVRVGSLSEGFYIEDDGPGIQAEQREELFEYGMSTASGSGFGLAIVRTIIEAHGWTITVADSDSDGARFEVDTGC